MTAYAATAVAKSQTLVIATVDSVILTNFGNKVRVINRSTVANDIIWFTIGTVLQPPVDPTVAGDNCYACIGSPAGMSVRWPPNASGLTGATNGVMVKLISAAASPYTVQLDDIR